MSATVLCALWALWPLVTMVGGGAGLAVLSGLAAILVAPSALKGFRPRVYMLLILAFFAYAAATAAWSPRPLAFVEVDFAKASMNVRNEVLRLAPLILAAGLLLGATMRLSDKGKKLVARFAGAALVAQILIVAVVSLFEAQILDALRVIVPDTGEGVQNITRNSLYMAAGAAALIAVIAGSRPLAAASLSAFGVLLVEGLVLGIRDVNAGALALGAAAFAIVVVLLLPRHGFRVLAVMLALTILTAPLTFGYLSEGWTAEAATTSAEWRLAIWARACDVIEQNPWTGAGLGALRTMREYITSGVFVGQLHMPNHPHNMALQLWAETGLVGASLLSAAILAAAFRLPSPRELGRGAIHVAGLAGGVSVIAFISFDLWNQDWWAAAGMLAALAATAPRVVRPQETIVQGRGIVFGAAAPPADAQPAAQPAGPSPELQQRADAVEAEPAVDMKAAAEPVSAHDNNFNLLRLVFAVMVAAYHLLLLTGLWPHTLPPLAVAAEVGVQGFFIVSGYLVAGSFERSRSLGVYAEKRVRRIFPAYAVVILACTIGALVFSPAARADLAAVGRYFAANIVFINALAPTLPGVFEGNKLPEVNGALWTLKVEVAFYIILPALALLLRVIGGLRWWLIGAVYIGAEIWRYVFENSGDALLRELAHQLPGQMSFFITGVALHLTRGKINWRSALVPIGAVLLVASFLAPGLEALRAAGLGVITMWVATGLPRLFDAAEYGDLSYGVYIVHFPVIQVALAAGLFVQPMQGLAVVVLAVLALALALWWLVERPALRRDSAYRQAA